VNDVLESRLRETTHLLADTTTVSADAFERIADRTQGRRRKRRGAVLAMAGALAIVVAGIGVIVATGDSSSDRTPSVQTPAPPSPTFGPVPIGYSEIATGRSRHGRWRLLAGREGELTCAVLAYAGGASSAPMKTCNNVGAGGKGSMATGGTGGTTGVVGIVPLDALSVVLPADGTLTTVRTYGAPGLGVRFFVLPDPGVSTRPTGFIAEDAAGHVVARIGSPS
jgi:hypothetical protein